MKKNENPTKSQLASRRTYWKRKAQHNATTKANYHKNRKEQSEKKKAQRNADPKNASEIYKRYRTKNKDKIEQRRKANINGLLAKRLRNRLRKLLRKTQVNKTNSALHLLGCTAKEFKIYIESKFTDGMCWERLNEIHIDHIKPCAKFDLTKESEQIKCFHYTNLQPLWSTDNFKKGTK